MSEVTWKSNNSGSWDTGADWSSGTVPSGSDYVYIEPTKVITVTQSTASVAAYYVYTSADAALDVTGGVLSVIYDSVLYGNFLQTAGTMKVSGSGLTSYGKFSQSGGTIDIKTGTVSIDGSLNSIGGLVNGGGWLEFGAGATTLASTVKLMVGHVDVAGGTVTLGASITYGGDFVATSGTLALNSKILTLSGTALLGGTTNGSGSVALTGIAKLGDGGVLDGSAVLSITGTTSLIGGYYYVGYSASSVSALEIQTTGTLRLAAGSTIYTDAVKAKLTNAGTLLVSGGGNNTVELPVTGSGVIDVAAGTLSLAGATSTLTGSVEGAGTIDYSAGAVAIKVGAGFSVGGQAITGAAVTLGITETYGGRFVMTSGTLTIPKSVSFTLTGQATLSGGDIFGGGTIDIASAAIGNGMDFDTTSAVTITGSATQTGYIYVSYLSSSTGSLDVASGATYTFAGNTDVYAGSGIGSFVNAGTVIATGATSLSSIGIDTDSTGSILVLGGTLDFEGSVNALGGTLTGSGEAAFDSGTTTLDTGLALTVGSIEVGGATLEFAGAFSFAGPLTFDAGQILLDSVGVTLSGPTLLSGLIDGDGTLTTSGGTVLSSVDVEGTATLDIAGSAEQTEYIYLGYNSGDASAIDVSQGATYLIDGGYIYAGAAATLTNAGTITVATDDSVTQIQPTVVNTGMIDALTGGIYFGAGVSGAGTVEIGNGASVEFSGSVDTATTVAFGGTAGQVTIDLGASFGATITGFSSFDEIALSNFNFLSAEPLKYANGVLTVSDGTNTAQLHFGGAGYSLSSFSVGLDSGGGLAIFHT